VFFEKIRKIAKIIDGRRHQQSDNRGAMGEFPVKHQSVEGE
jgi:hypothetical protein